MNFGQLGRVAILALTIFVSGIWAALAHGLPSSTLTFSKLDGQLKLSISLPLEDLIIAAPSLEALEKVDVKQELPAGSVQRISQYLLDHLDLKQAGEVLPVGLVDASIQTAENEHVGVYKLLVVELMTQIPKNGKILPLTMTYDAVIHEIRNHRADVYWKQPSNGSRKVADFSFHTTGKMPQQFQLLKH